MKTRTESLRRIYVTLRKRRDALRQSLRVDATELQSGANDVGDSIDAALDAEHQAVQSQMTTAETLELARIEAALQLFAAGQYGRCETCDAAIPLARLQAIPYATHCVNCQRAAEQANVNRPPNAEWSTWDETELNHDHVTRS